MVPSWMPAIVVNVFALIVLLVLLIDYSTRQAQTMLHDQRLFRWMMITNIVLLVLDGATWLLNGQVFPGARALNLAVTAGYYSLTPVVSVLYLSFCDIKLGVPVALGRRYRRFYLIPLGINLLLSLWSVQSALLYRIGPDNVYSRGSLLALSFVLSYCLLPLAFVRLFRAGARVRRTGQEGAYLPNRAGIRALLLFPMFPLVGGAILVFYNQVTVVWLTSVFALLIFYLNLQSIEISTDSLTGLFNRRQTDMYLRSLLQDAQRCQTLCLAVLDINNFKQINDQYGHMVGDHALKMMATVLHAVCGRSTFNSRYGGDEFVIVTKAGGRPRMAGLVEQINRKMAQALKAEQAPYPITISAGIAEWSPEYQTFDRFFAAADMRLYESKASLKRRAADRARQPAQDG